MPLTDAAPAEAPVSTEGVPADDDLMSEVLSSMPDFTDSPDLTGSDNNQPQINPTTPPVDTATSDSTPSADDDDEVAAEADTSLEDSEDEEVTDETEPDEEEQNEAEEEEDEPEAGSKATQKRIDKLTAQKSKYLEERDAAREEIETLRSDLEEAQRSAVTLTPTPANPLAHLADEKALAEYRTNAEAVLAWASHPDNRDGAVVGDDEYSAEDVADKRRRAELELQLHLPKRLEWLQKNRQHSQQARQQYPFLFKSGPASDAASEILTQAPGIMEMPDYEMLVGDALIGRATRNGFYRLVPVNKAGDDKSTDQSKPKAKAAAVKPQPKPPAAPSKTAPATRPAPTAASAASRRLLESAGDDPQALTDFAASLLED